MRVTDPVIQVREVYRRAVVNPVEVNETLQILPCRIDIAGLYPGLEQLQRGLHELRGVIGDGIADGNSPNYVSLLLDNERTGRFGPYDQVRINVGVGGLGIGEHGSNQGGRFAVLPGQPGEPGDRRQIFFLVPEIPMPFPELDTLRRNEVRIGLGRPVSECG